MRLLRVDSSARTYSVTRQLTAAFVAAWKQTRPDTEVLERDLARTALPLITDEWSATFGDPTRLTAAQQDYLATSDVLVAELFAADVILIGAPMYNFTISAPLKAWIDQIVRLGKTVTYGPSGPQGLLANKKVVVVSSRGGAYSPDPGAPNFDLEEAYLRRILAFVGLLDVTFVHAENQMRKESAAHALAVATERIVEVVVQAAAAVHAV